MNVVASWALIVGFIMLSIYALSEYLNTPLVLVNPEGDCVQVLQRSDTYSCNYLPRRYVTEFVSHNYKVKDNEPF